MLRKILISVAVMLLISAPVIASIGWLGNADRTFKDGEITCMLGALATGMPTYFCGWNTIDSFVMEHSWLASSNSEMNKYYTSGSTSTFTFTAK